MPRERFGGTGCRFDAVGFERLPYVRWPIPRPVSVSTVLHPVASLRDDIADFRHLGQLPDERYVYVNTRTRFELWRVIQEVVYGEDSAAALNELAKQIQREIEAISVGPIVRLYDITTPMAHAWEREVWGVAHPR